MNLGNYFIEKGILKCYILLVILIFIFTSLSSFAIGVKPLVVDFNIKPGQEKEFSISLFPSDKAEKVELSLYQPFQEVEGNLIYLKGDIHKYPALDWVELEKDNIIVYPEDEVKLKGKIKVPYDVGGSHTVVIMIESEAQEQSHGVAFIFRYAVRLNININKSGLSNICDVSNISLKKGELGQPIVETYFDNESDWHHMVSGEVTIRDQNRRLVERVTLRSPVAIENSRLKTKVFSGSKVKFLGEIIHNLSPGNYVLRTFFRYGAHGQVLKSKKITIKEGDFNFPRSDDIGAFSTDTELIELQLKPGQRKSEVIKLQSEIGDESY
ncbi:MAG: hypothetical protein ACOCRO_08745, partial [Halanaerobiales bacterium]